MKPYAGRRIRTRLRRAPTALLLSALGACSFAPHYEPPATVAAPAAYQELGDWKPADAAVAARTEWWKDFQDPALDWLQGGSGKAARGARRYPHRARRPVSDAQHRRQPHPLPHLAQ
jgi:outer membrane protein TolC